MKSYDVILIGTGQATGTILPKILKEKLSVAIIEEDRVGGTCVNWGCTPTKALVASARVARMVRRSDDFGIEVPKMQINFAGVMERVNAIRNDATSGFRKWLEEVSDFYPAQGRFIDEHTVAVGESTIRGEAIIIHTGTRARKPDILGINTIPWLNNRGILDLKELPEHLLIVGGSYIGLEFGQAFRRFGSRVTVFEHGERIVYREDPEISTIAQELLEAEGMDFHLNSSPLYVEQKGKKIILRYAQGKDEHEITGTHILMATGRIPSSAELNLSAAGIETDKNGYISVDDYGRTSKKHIYALGDVNGKGAFTHTSVHDGQVFLDHFFKQGKRRISDRTRTYVMYIDPPLARVGMNETEAAEKGIDALVGTMPMSLVSRAKEKAETLGTMKVVVEKSSGKLLGATIFGVGGDEVIGMLALAIQAGLPYSTLQNTVIPHPTVGEMVPWLFADLKLLPVSNRGGKHV